MDPTLLLIIQPDDAIDAVERLVALQHVGEKVLPQRRAILRMGNPKPAFRGAGEIRIGDTKQLVQHLGTRPSAGRRVETVGAELGDALRLQQLPGRFFQHVHRLLAPGDVPERGQFRPAALMLDEAATDFHGKPRAVLFVVPAQGNKSVAAAGRHARFFRLGGNLLGSHLQKLLPAVAVKPQRRLIAIQKAARFAVHQHERIGFQFKQLPVKFLALPHFFQRQLALGDVEHGGDDLPAAGIIATAIARAGCRRLCGRTGIRSAPAHPADWPSVAGDIPPGAAGLPAEFLHASFSRSPLAGSSR